MSLDMSTLLKHGTMTDRKHQILQIAIEMIADEGYASLTMRALARANGMKLGALQYHFRTSDDMLRALVDYIAESYRQSFKSLQDAANNKSQPLGLRQVVIFILKDKPGEALLSDRLWPQLWAMQLVEPLVSDLVDDIYAIYVEILEKALSVTGKSTPRAEALFLMSLLEGSTIFMASGRRWEKDTKVFYSTVLEFIDNRYGEQS